MTKGDLVAGNVYTVQTLNVKGDVIATGNVSATLGIKANSINATGNVTSSARNVEVTGNLTAKNVEAGTTLTAASINASGKVSAKENITVTGNLKANEVELAKTENGDGVIKADSITATGNVSANNNKINVTNDLTAKDVSGKAVTADSISATGNVTASNGDVNVTNNLTAKDVSGKNVTANNITADTVTASERVSVADTLSVTKSLNASEATASTVILSKGATATGNITTDTLQVDPSTAATALANTTVKAATAGSTINIADADGFAITNQNLLASIAAAAGLQSGSYISVITDFGKQNIPGMIDRIGTWNPFEEKLFDIASLGDLPEADIAKWRAQFAQAYRESEPVHDLVNATANAGAVTTQAISGAFTLGAASRTADLRAGAPASAVIDNGGAESDTSSLWVSIKGGKTTVDGGDYADTRVRVTTYQAGYDFRLSDADYLGVYLGTATGYAQTDGRYSKRIDIKHAWNYGLYGTHEFGGGRYLDYMLQGGKFDNKIEGHDTWGTKSFGGVIGYGWKYRTQSKQHELTWNPYVRFKYDHIKMDDRTFAGNKVTTDDENALSMKLGLDVSTDFGLYGGIAYSRGLSGSLSSYVNSFAMPSSDFDDNVIYLNLGYKGYVNENTMFNLNFEKTFCDYDGWTAEARVDFLF